MLKRKIQTSLLAAILAGLTISGIGAQTVTINGYKAYDGRVLVRPKVAAGGLHAFAVPGGAVAKRFDSAGLLLLKRNDAGQLRALNEDQKAAEMKGWIQQLKDTGQFEYVEPDYQLHIDLEPTDARFQDGTLWGLKNTGQNGGLKGADISAPEAWEITTGSTNVIVGVIDTGVRYTHQELRKQMWINPTEIPNNGLDDDNDGFVDNIYGIDAVNNDGDPMDDNDHGTHVSGTIGAAANDGNPHVGVAWNVRIMALKFLADDGFGATSGAIECIDFARKRGVKILNNSCGGGPYEQSLYDAIRAARDAGVLFIASAGNDANDNDRFPAYPASYDLDNIIAVAALDRRDNLANFSNYGATKVDVGAPGVEIFSSVSSSDSAYDVFEGTSMAAPHVTGIAALVAAFVPGASYSEIRDRILNGVVTVPSLAGKVSTGGRVNAFKALTKGVDGVLEVSVNPPSGSLISLGAQTPIFVTITDGPAVTNAVVKAAYGEGTITFQNDGQAPDLMADDGTYSAVLNPGNIEGPVTLGLTITAPGKTNYSATINYDAVPRPANDLFANPVKVPVQGGSYDQTTRFATIENLEPAHAGIASVDASVWYTWSLKNDARVLVDTAGSTFDTVIGVYNGISLSNLTEVASVNDVGEKRQGWLKFDAKAGVSYKIAVAGSTNGQSGQLHLRLEINGEPDNTAPIVQVTSPPSGITVHTNRIVLTGTAFDPQPNSSGIREVQVSVNGDVAKTVAGTTNWISTNLLSLGVNTLTVVAFDFAENRSREENVTVLYQQQTSDNDLFVYAFPLTGNSGTVGSDSSQATKEFMEPNHAGNEGGRSVWFYYQPAESGILFLSTAGSSFDTLLGVYTGSRVSSLTEVASNDDVIGAGKYSEVTFGVQAGQVYNIAVDGFDASSGQVQLSYNFQPAPTNRISATSLGGGTVTPSEQYLPLNATVTITANPDPGFQFAQFENAQGQVISTQNPATFVVTGSSSIVARFVPRTFTDDFQSGFKSSLGYVNDGWAVITDPVSPDNKIASSTTHRDKGTNSLVLTVETPGGIGSFNFQVHSEVNYDKLEFFVNDVLRGIWSGDVPSTDLSKWSTFQFELFPGVSKLEWRYSKDVAISVSTDAAYLDNLNLPIGAPQITAQVVAHGAQLEITGTPLQRVVVESSKNLKDWKLLTTVQTANDGKATFTDDGEVAPRFYRARSE
jgi:subtilisin family serine protease